jgi:hypothetical protein
MLTAARNEAIFLALADRRTARQRNLFRGDAISAGTRAASDLSHRLGLGCGFLDLPGVLWSAAAHPLNSGD